MFGLGRLRGDKPVTGGDPWKARLAFGAVVLVAGYFVVQLVVALQTLWLLIFGAIVVAVILRALADPIVRFLKAPDPLAVFLSLLIVVAVLAGVLTLFGAGWDQGRYRFAADGTLQPDWSESCQAE